MKISTRGRYASRALLYIAYRNKEGPVTLRSICKDEKISFKYLENIIRPMVSDGILISIKGKNGGFRLARKPSGIKLSDILQSVEGSLDPVYCVSHSEACEKGRDCIFRDIWTELKLRTFEYLNSITLADIMKRQDIKLKMVKKRGKAPGKSSKKSIYRNG